MYGECMRNHAASLGAYASDGCGEFFADNSRPGGHFCAACGCHRNFHCKLLPGNYSSHLATEERLDGRRRARTKFTAEQKSNMRSFAERLGWRMPKQPELEGELEVERFCTEVGVSRQVFKVWMHNHKNGGAASGASVTPANSSSATNSDGWPAGCSIESGQEVEI
ncbi:hypothetical protein HPP92_027044 [Vanilla planifolia]|uniref:ZF-HD dimerization-type domain-containing protein n=1 Tax=Vanilla planifolia TaxID=51239 RepID=A0A835PA74_VANPL|nr:hypothetical protein HPP92_027163 [Vanilla planifolia]KAG0449901.1 hypothetical protein HPP92_027044 [Vanilla planifolia]